METSVKLALLSAALALVVNVGASGVPTIDGANMAQMLVQFRTLTDQLNNMKTNVKMVTDTKDNFIGQIEYYKNLISNISFTKTAQGYIPNNASEVLAIIKEGLGTSNPKLVARIDEIMKSSPALQELSTGEKKMALEKARREMAYYQAAFEQAYNAAGERQNMAAQLGEQSAKVTNEKEARALALAMQQQNLVAVNDVAKILTMEQMRQAKEFEESQKAKEESAKAIQKLCAELKEVGGMKCVK